MVSTLRAVPTTYAGTTFRSRLEAEWALNLTLLGIGWVYEPEAYELLDGQRYLPDFWLPETRTWLEVKGPHGERTDKCEQFARMASHHSYCDMSDSGECGCFFRPEAMFVVGETPGIYGEMRFHGTESYQDITLIQCAYCRRMVFFDEMQAWVCRACDEAKPQLSRWEWRGDSTYALRAFARLPRWKPGR